MRRWSERTRQKRRLERQFVVAERRLPRLAALLAAARSDRGRLVRIPAAILLMLGSLLSILPVFGLWMFPLGFLLLAVDVPALRPTASAFAIRARRWSTGRLRRLRSRFSA